MNNKQKKKQEQTNGKSRRTGRREQNREREKETDRRRANPIRKFKIKKKDFSLAMKSNICFDSISIGFYWVFLKNASSAYEKDGQHPNRVVRLAQHR